MYLLRHLSIFSALLALAAGPLVTPRLSAGETQDRQRAQKLYKERNFAEAYDLLKKLIAAPDTDPFRLPDDIQLALDALDRLGRAPESDDLREMAVRVHAGNWRVLLKVSSEYRNRLHYGHMIAGEFKRGRHRGQGKQVSAQERDRIRSLQLLVQALPLIADDDDDGARASFYLDFAQVLLMGRGRLDAWQLQTLSDLSKLPDYEEGHGWRTPQTSGAPVDMDGVPVWHQLPESFESAMTDGERWRWLLGRAGSCGDRGKARAEFALADFLYGQFGVQTMGHTIRPVGRSWGAEKNTEAKETGIFAVQTLDEDETIAKLASGIKRFRLPDEFNYIAILRRLAQLPVDDVAKQSLQRLATLFENRRQYDRALTFWKAYRRFDKSTADDHIHQIADNWGTFEPVTSQPAGRNPTVDYRFRNGREVAFTAHRVDLRKLLADVKSYIESRPARIEHQKVNLGQIGYRLVRQNETKYIRDKAAEWTLSLTPREGHFDRRITVEIPLKDAGVYLLVGRMADGNTSRILVWLDDTAIAKKNLGQDTLYFVADARTGAPLPQTNVEFFGWRQEWIRKTKRHTVHTTRFAENTDDNGLIILPEKRLPRNWQWIAIATTPDGRLAYFGFHGVWYSRHADTAYLREKALIITDRPVYRPGDTVHIKAWVRRATYDLANTSVFAGQEFPVEIRDARGNKILEKSFIADDFGGFEIDLPLDEDAGLGTYRINIKRRGGGSFRVEEYKKPEYEVSVEAPSVPVMLGDVVKAKVNARYYFGAPVTEATVKVKVLRYAHSERWYPPMPWDWFYGVGYSWFAPDYDWYPGWRLWGCPRPGPWWFPRRSPPPEVVMESETAIGSDGTVAFDIDTRMAKEIHGDLDHRYEITAEVRDRSRRTIVGTGKVLVARKPFAVRVWVDRGYYRTGDRVQAQFRAFTLDQKPVRATGTLKLLRITYTSARAPIETEIESWPLTTDNEGLGQVLLTPNEPGQYRLSAQLTDAAGHTIEGGYVFVVRGPGLADKNVRFNELELLADKAEYAPGEDAQLMINAKHANATVLLFTRPAKGIYGKPKVLRMNSKSRFETVAITQKDMPNIFVEGMTIVDGRVYSEIRELVVPPQKRVLNVEVTPSAPRFRPGAKGNVRIRLSDLAGKPFAGTTALTIYDKSVEYISGGGNVPEIREFFWKWRRRHHPRTESSLQRSLHNLLKKGEKAMRSLGVFGHMIADEMAGGMLAMEGGGGMGGAAARTGAAYPRRAMKSAAVAQDGVAMEGAMVAMAAAPPANAAAASDLLTPTVRSDFADTARWVGTLDTDANGEATVPVTLPDNLTTWVVKTWAMGHGTRVGQGRAEVITSKDLLLRLQAPRFFVEKDQVVLSANVHNYLDHQKLVTVQLELDGGCIELASESERTVRIPPKGEARVDWRVVVSREGEAVVRMKALTDEESDAMEMRFPVFVHGMDKMTAACLSLRPEDERGTMTFDVPEARRPEASRLEVRFSPTLAMAMIDSLPYLAGYPYGCTEQTLNRFLPTVMVQSALKRMGLSLSDVAAKTTNLNAQELGDPAERAKQWKRGKLPVTFDDASLATMVKDGVQDLTNMQLSDGGWGWFSGYGERSYPHTTGVVVRGLLLARANGVAIVPGVVERGIEWLNRYQAEELRKLERGEADKPERPFKRQADNLDAFVYSVLAETDKQSADMRGHLYRDRTHLSVYALAMLGVAFHRQGHAQEVAMLRRNVEQYLKRDDENQTAYLDLPNGGYWWFWYGSETEAHAYYLKLLSRLEPKGQTASRLVKYLLNNRKHASYWNSTRDTALCIEAFCDYLAATGEAEPNARIRVLLDGRQAMDVTVSRENLLTFDNTLVVEGTDLTAGRHTVEFVKTGSSPLYANAYMSFFTLEDPIKATGLEVRITRKFYQLHRVEASIHAAGSRGQAVSQKVEKYRRTELPAEGRVGSGDLIEVELVVDSKNDYEYIILEDMKPAGVEPVDLRSGYNGNEMGAYAEFRDEKVCFFVRRLARGKHSLSYRVRAETPGRFSALPTTISAMYAPELRGNADELKLRIIDMPEGTK